MKEKGVTVLAVSIDEHPAIWLCESCAILWLVLRVVRSPLVRTGVRLMLMKLERTTASTATITPSNENG
jgi:hypothetical protein